MNLIVTIPDDIAGRLSVSAGDLLRRALGFETSDQIDGFLKRHGVWIDYTLEDLDRERAGLNRLGL